jgi:hypothetical protein
LVQIDFDPAEAGAPGGDMRFSTFIAAAAAMAMTASGPAYASLVGATVQSGSHLDLASTECTIFNCALLHYQGPSGPTTFPPPIVPVTYLEDSLTLTTVSVGDTKITITSNVAGQFGMPGTFSGYVFQFTGAPDISKVTVDSASSPDFPPVFPDALGFTVDAISVNVAGDNLAVGDQLILDVTTGVGAPAVPEPSTWALMLLGFAGLGFAGWRRSTAKAA